MENMRARAIYADDLEQACEGNGSKRVMISMRDFVDGGKCAHLVELGIDRVNVLEVFEHLSDNRAVRHREQLGALQERSDPRRTEGVAQKKLRNRRECDQQRTLK
jgi:hypothetical protein